MLSDLLQSLRLAYGHWLWTRRPDKARARVLGGVPSFRTHAARHYYRAVLEPALAMREWAAAERESRCQQIVRPEDFDFVREIHQRRGYELNGILPLESALLIALIRHYRPALFLESGTYRGQSAVVLCEALARFCPDAAFHTVSPNEDGCLDVARARLAAFAFAHVHEGTSETVFPKLLDGRNCAVFIDGPKAGSVAFTEVLNAIDRAGHVAFVAIHDCEWTPPDSPYEKLERLRIEEWFERTPLRTTHELWYMDSAWCERNAAAWDMMPAQIPGGIHPHWFSGQPQVSATPVLGVISRKQTAPLSTGTPGERGRG